MRALTLVLAAVLALGGCAAPDPVAPRRSAPLTPPLPAGASTVTSVAAAPAGDTNCADPTASLRPTGPPPAPGNFPKGSYLALIRDRGKLVVGVDQNTFQFGFRDPRTGQLEGFDIDMAREIARAIFGDPDRIQFRVLTSARRVEAVTKGEVDLVVQTMTITCERAEEVAFSSVYYEARQMVLVREDSGHTGIESLGGKKVCAAAGSTSLAAILAADVDPKPVGVSVEGWTDCLVMLQQHQVDAISTDDTILAGMRAQDPHTEIVGAPLSSEPYGMAMPRGQVEFVRFVNAVLDRMRADGTWVALRDTWLSGLLDPTPPPAATYRD